MEINQENFEEKVVKSTKPIIVDYWAPWCAPCKMMAPVFEKISQEMKEVTFAKVNVDENNQLASDQGILNLPCIVIYNNGEEIERIVGFHNEQQFKAKITQALS